MHWLTDEFAEVTDVIGVIRTNRVQTPKPTLDGMVYGRVIRPPSRGATLRDIDTAPIQSMPGIIAVVRDGDFLAVIAEHEEVALRAADRLRRNASWNRRPTLPDCLGLASRVGAIPVANISAP